MHIASIIVKSAFVGLIVWLTKKTFNNTNDDQSGDSDEIDETQMESMTYGGGLGMMLFGS